MLVLRQVSVCESGLSALSYTAHKLTHVNVSGVNSLTDQILTSWSLELSKLQYVNIGWNYREYVCKYRVELQ